MNKALFLDRDGIMNVDKGYVYKWEDIIWVEEIFDIIKLANERGYKVIVLTNQSGIDKGMYTKDDVDGLHEKMDLYLKQKGLTIDGWYYCAEMDSEFRKPRPGMLLQAAKEHSLDFTQSFMVGDKATDVFETDGVFSRPETLLVKGAYNLDHPDLGNHVNIYKTHKELYETLKKLL